MSLVKKEFESLVSQLNEANIIEYKGVYFDNWAIDKETGGIYGEMCEECAEKYKDMLLDELSDGAIGSCSTLGCATVGADVDTDGTFM